MGQIHIDEPINLSTRWGRPLLFTRVNLHIIITFAHGNHSQGIPVAMVPTVHHDGLFQTLKRGKTLPTEKNHLKANNAKLLLCRIL